jgi:hypothetical protein
MDSAAPERPREDTEYRAFAEEDISEILKRYAQECREVVGKYQKNKKALEARLEAIARNVNVAPLGAKLDHFEKSLHSKKEERLNGLLWFLKILVAGFVAYPAHSILARWTNSPFITFPGIKISLFTYIPVTALLLVAEVMLMYSCALFMDVANSKRFLLGKYSLMDLQRGIAFRLKDFGQLRGRFLNAWIFFILAILICAVDAGVNYLYVLDKQDSVFPAAAAAAYYSLLLVGMAVLLGVTREYIHMVRHDSATIWKNTVKPKGGKKTGPLTPKPPKEDPPNIVPPKAPEPEWTEAITLKGDSYKYRVVPGQWHILTAGSIKEVPTEAIQRFLDALGDRWTPLGQAPGDENTVWGKAKSVLGDNAAAVESLVSLLQEREFVESRGKAPLLVKRKQGSAGRNVE